MTSAEVLAAALCDSSSHMNLLPHSDQRPCAYHMQRATDALALMQRRRPEGDSYGIMHLLPPRERPMLVLDEADL